MGLGYKKTGLYLSSLKASFHAQWARLTHQHLLSDHCLGKLVTFRGNIQILQHMKHVDSGFFLLFAEPSGHNLNRDNNAVLHMHAIVRGPFLLKNLCVIRETAA